MRVGGLRANPVTIVHVPHERMVGRVIGSSLVDELGHQRVGERRRAGCRRPHIRKRDVVAAGELTGGAAARVAAIVVPDEEMVAVRWSPSGETALHGCHCAFAPRVDAGVTFFAALHVTPPFVENA